MHSKVKLAEAYQKTDVYSGTLAADPHRLITLMLDGVLTRVSQAGEAIKQNDLPRKTESIAKSIRIVGALDGCLNYQQGGEIADNLSLLYEYICLRLAEANLHNDISKINEVKHLLSEIRSAWVQLPSLIERATA